MASDDKPAIGEDPCSSPIGADPSSPSKQRWMRADVSPKMLAVLFLIGILQYLVFGLLGVYGFLGDGPHVARIDFISYFAFWSSVGGLIGFAVSRTGVRGSVIGAITGLILSALLMC
jgi:hypothetical protein